MKHTLAKTLMVSALSLSFAFPALAAPETYTIDPNHTNVIWFANHFGFSNPSGKFAAVSGTLTLDEANPANSKVSVSIATATLMTGIAKFDEHLKSADFFDVAQYPAANFVSNQVEITGSDTAKVHGTLTLRGVAKPVVLDVKLNKIGEFPMNHKKTAGFSASTILKRSDFGMSYGLPGVADDVKVIIESEANK